MCLGHFTCSLLQQTLSGSSSGQRGTILFHAKRKCYLHSPEVQPGELPHCPVTNEQPSHSAPAKGQDSCPLAASS